MENSFFLSVFFRPSFAYMSVTVYGITQSEDFLFHRNFVMAIGSSRLLGGASFFVQEAVFCNISLNLSKVCCTFLAIWCTVCVCYFVLSLFFFSSFFILDILLRSNEKNTVYCTYCRSSFSSKNWEDISQWKKLRYINKPVSGRKNTMDQMRKNSKIEHEGHSEIIDTRPLPERERKIHQI